MFHRVALSLLLIAAGLFTQDAAGQTPARPGGPMRLMPRDQAGDSVPPLPTPPATTNTTTSTAPVPSAPTVAPTAPTPPVTGGQPLQLRPQGATSPPLQPIAPGGATVPPPAGTPTDLKGMVLQQLGIPGGTTAGLATPGAVLPDRSSVGSAALPPPVSALPRKATGSGQRRAPSATAPTTPSGQGGAAAVTPQAGQPLTGEAQSLARDRRRFEPHVFQRTQPRLPMTSARKDFEPAKPAQPRYPLDTSTLYPREN